MSSVLQKTSNARPPFAKQPNIFFVPKVLIIFYPYKHPSQSLKLKDWLKGHFFWTPCLFIAVQNGSDYVVDKKYCFPLCKDKIDCSLNTGTYA